LLSQSSQNNTCLLPVPDDKAISNRVIANLYGMFFAQGLQNNAYSSTCAEELLRLSFTPIFDKRLGLHHTLHKM